MSQPTGEHASSVELAAAHVKVTVETNEGIKQVHTDLEGLEAHGKIVGANTGTNIVTGIAAAGEPAAKAFSDKLKASTVTTEAAGKAHADTFMSNFIKTLRDTKGGAELNFLFHGAEQEIGLAGARGAENFTGRMIQVLAVNRIRAEQEAAKTGESVSKGVKKGVESAGEGLGIGEAVEKASKNLKVLGVEGGEAGEKMLGIGGAIGALATDPIVLVGAAIIGVTGTVTELMHKLYELGAETDEVWDSLIIKTGAAGDKLEDLKGIVNGVAGQVPLSMGKIGDITAAVSQSFRDTGLGAQEVVTQVGKLESMVGQVNLTQLGNAFRAFDIAGDSKQQVEVLNQLFQASQATGIGFNEMVSAFARCASTFKALNLNAGQSVAVIAEFDEAGVSAEKSQMALTKATAYAIKHHQDLNEVLEDTAKKVRDAKTEQDKLAAAAPVFGMGIRGGAAAFVQAVSGGADFSKETLEKAAQVGPVIDNTAERVHHFAQSWQEVKNQVQVALEPLSGRMFELVQHGLEGFSTWVSQHTVQIAVFFGEVGKAAAVMVEGLVKTVAAVAQVFGDIQSVIGRFIKWFGDAVSGIGGILSDIPGLDGFGNKMDAAGKKLQGFGDQWNEAGKVVTNWGANLQHISSDIVPKAFEDINKAIDETKAKAGGTVQQLQAIPGAITAINSVHPNAIDVPVNAKPGEGVTLSADGKSIQVIMSISPATGLPAGAPGAPPGGIPPISPTDNPDLPGVIAQVPHRQQGGGIGGYGGGDIVPALLEHGEHVTTKEEVAGVGGHGNMLMIRALMRHGILGQILGFQNVAGGQWSDEGTDQPGYRGHRAYGYNPDSTAHIPMPLQRNPDWANGPRLGNDPGGGLNWNQRALGDQGGVLGSGSPGNASANFGMWFGTDTVHAAEGGKIHPAGMDRKETGWVLDRFKMAGIKPAHFAGGGEVDVMSLLSAESGRTPYVLGGFTPRGIDCSGLVSEAVNTYLGLPPLQSRMNTSIEASWLAAKGFVQGKGPPGTFRIGFYNGGPGGGHTALTLPSGINAESGGSGGGVRLGGGAAGADNPEFSDHWYLPSRSIVQPGGYGGTGSGGSGGYGGAGGASGASGGGGGASPEQIQAADTKVTGAQGKLDVLNQRVTEAEQHLQEVEAKVPKGPKGEAGHAKAVAEAQQHLKDIEAERDQAQGDLDSVQGERANLTGETDPKALISAKDRITDANRRLEDAQAKLDRDRANPKIKPSEITADENAVAAAKERVAKAEQHLQEVESRPEKKGKKDKGDDFVGAIGDATSKGLIENLPPGFSNPLGWGAVKSGAAFLRFLARPDVAGKTPGAAGGLGLFADLLGGKGGAVGDDIMSLVGGGGAQAYTAGGDIGSRTADLNAPPGEKTAGGNTINIDKSSTYNGDIHNGEQFHQAKLASEKRDIKKTLQRWTMT